MKVTVLIENTAPEGSGLSAEHGLALYIEHRGRELLLDAGASGAFADNAAALGVDLSRAELAVLSHGHSDHSDGLRRFFQLNSRAKVHARRGAEGPIFALGEEGPAFIGIHRDIWRESRDRFVLDEGLVELGDGAWLVPCTLRDPNFTGRAANLVQKRGRDDFIPDDFGHEHALALEGEGGLAIFSSCSHSGIVNIVRDVQRQLPDRRTTAVVGGLHMFGKDTSGMNCTPEYVYSVADALKELGVRELYTGHCTGDPAFALLRERFGPGCYALTTGLRFSIL